MVFIFNIMKPAKINFFKEKVFVDKFGYNIDETKNFWFCPDDGNILAEVLI